MVMISKRDYAAMYGPTTGDRVRLGDTNLITRVERDHAHYGEECLTGLGKTMRDGLAVNAGHTAAAGAIDTILNNVMIMDPVLGIVKADMGIRDGKITGIGKAGNPATMAGVDDGLIVGPSTKPITCQGLIATPGGDGSPGRLLVTARAEDIGNNEGEIDAIIEGEEAKIAFNGRYLHDVLEALDSDRVAIEASSPSSPGVLRPVGDDSYVHVVMPMFVQW